MRVAIVCIWTGDLPAYLLKVAENHQRYADVNGFSYIFKHIPVANANITSVTENRISEEIRASVWNQIIEVSRIINTDEYDYIFKIDSDAVIGNMDYDFRKLIKGGKSFIISGDQSDIFNGGNWIVKNNDFSRSLIKDWLRYSNYKFRLINTSHQTSAGYLSDQPAMNIVLRAGKGAILDELDVVKVFNFMNGFTGNVDRKFKYFHKLFAPLDKKRTFLAKRLIHREIRREIKVLPQRVLNSYEYKPSRQTFIHHFAGGKKTEILPFLSCLDSGFDDI